MKLVFAGTPEIAISTLDALVQKGHQVELVITREDAPVGRKRIITPSPVAAWAVEHDIPVLKTNRFDESALARLKQTDAQLGVVVAYGGLLPAEALDTLPLGWINLHFSALPDLRGAAPVQRALMRGDASVATSVFRLVSALDAGPVFSTESTPISPDETAGELLSRLGVSGAEQVVDTVSSIERGDNAPIEQSGEITIASKLSASDGAFDPSETGRQSYARFKGVTPEPGMWFLDGESRVKILEARLSALKTVAGAVSLDSGKAYLGTATVALELLRVQPSGKPGMNGADWARGRRNARP